MNFNSKFFDSIRVKPDKDRLLRDRYSDCDWQGCREPGRYPAPQGRGRDGQYFNFCLAHVRQYNKSYNYFSGMSNDEVSSYQKNTITGHRPTWSMGVNPTLRNGGTGDDHQGQPRGFKMRFDAQDAFGFFYPSEQSERTRTDARRPIRNVERKCLNALDLSETADAAEIKTRFKTLVKRHHPDANEGASGSEEKLREVIQAYNYLKQAGLC